MFEKASNTTDTLSLSGVVLIPKDSRNREDNHFKVPVLSAYSDPSSLKRFSEIVTEFMEGVMI